MEGGAFFAFRLAVLICRETGGWTLSEDETSPTGRLKGALAHQDALSSQLKTLIDQMAVSKPAIEQMARLNKNINSAMEPFRKAAEAYKQALPNIKQQETETSMPIGAPRGLPEMPIIRNPAYDTNLHLEEVAERLGALEELMATMAATVQAVSVSAAEFLVKFQAASKQADKVSRRAMFWAVMAIIGTFAVTAIQIGYTEYRAYVDGRATEAEVAAIKSRLDRLISMQSTAQGDVGAGTGTAP